MKWILLMMISVVTLFATVDVNNAGIEELTSLKGIGTKKAQSIITYRKAHCFKKVDDIIKVKGLGEKFLKNNRANIKIGKCKK